MREFTGLALASTLPVGGPCADPEELRCGLPFQQGGLVKAKADRLC